MASGRRVFFHHSAAAQIGLVVYQPLQRPTNRGGRLHDRTDFVLERGRSDVSKMQITTRA